VSQTRSDAEDLDGTSAEVEPQDAAERKAAKADRKADGKKSSGKSAPAKKAAGKKRPSPALFYRQIVAELRKVVWPTRNELFAYTRVVIVFVTVIIAIVALLDDGISRLIQAVFG
jgi:preprotein translocase subunit SecE